MIRLDERMLSETKRKLKGASPFGDDATSFSNKLASIGCILVTEICRMGTMIKPQMNANKLFEIDEQYVYLSIKVHQCLHCTALRLV